MSARFEIIDGGNTLWCFDRRGSKRENGILNINGACGSKNIRPGCEVSEWISQKLAERNGSSSPCFVWLNPHAARLLWFEGVLIEEIITAVAETGRRQFKDSVDTGECLVCPDVLFQVGGRSVKLTVVISSRDPYRQISLVEGEIPEEGRIDLGSMGKETKSVAV